MTQNNNNSESFSLTHQGIIAFYFQFSEGKQSAFMSVKKRLLTGEFAVPTGKQ